MYSSSDDELFKEDNSPKTSSDDGVFSDDGRPQEFMPLNPQANPWLSRLSLKRKFEKVPIEISSDEELEKSLVEAEIQVSLEMDSD